MNLFSKTFFCPNLVSQVDEVMIAEALQNSPGIESMEFDRAMHSVFVTTANQDGMRDVEWLLDDAGYPPEDREPATTERSFEPGQMRT